MALNRNHSPEGTTEERLTLAKKKEKTMSQIDSLVNPDIAVLKLQVFVASRAVRQHMDQPPMGSGSNIRPVRADTGRGIGDSVNEGG